MSQSGDNVLRSMFQGGNPSSGPLVKRLRLAKKTTRTSSKSPAKGKNQGPSAIEKVPPPPPAMEKMAPPPPRPPVPTREQEVPTGTLSAPTPGVRVLVNPQALEKVPEVFRGTVYETATYMVDHCYNATPRDLLEIETRSPENVMESSLGMTLTVALALHRSISRSRARIEEIRGEHQAAQVALASAQQQERDAKAALEAARENERVAQAASVAAQTELEASRAKLQEAEATRVALDTVKIEVEEAKDARATLDAAKVEVEEAKAALVAEKEASSSSMEAMLYHCWAFNQDGDFSFLGPDVWGSFVEKFKARLQQEAPSEIGETFTTTEQDGKGVTSSERPGGA
ncbi:uncharacterized protein LOC133799037 [Humulus lupulus]|uniref:uncharacterized protein LOC133799037 n=1 Tax=Humulus lupulus TaxID=3486 RepID=UPI002B409FC7|nr:uncharacterized protein LOC133799037 [Humulus lupulus]XP_062093258.1 uncharacterized protein LOC133799037 [Humulus lupulus]